jgi:large subunit ribosomal protein L30
MGRNPAVGRQGPAYHEARLPATPAAEGLRVKQIRSGIGRAATMRRTLEALGLRHHQQEVVVPDTPSIRGMLYKVRHLVEVTPVGEAT